MTQLAQEQVVDLIIRELTVEYQPHSMILYGSRARGEASSASDLDIALFVDEIEETKRDARFIHGIYLDAFIYPTSILSTVDESLFKIRSGKILKERSGFCKRVLQAIEELYLKGPKKISSDEIQVKKVWARKMLERAKIADTEGNYRRVWLLTALIEDFYALRGEWYLGPKESFKNLKVSHPQIFNLYTKALKQEASIKDIEFLVEAIIDENS